jgi:hypothetical protein
MLMATAVFNSFATPSNAEEIKPEMIVQFSHGTLVCLDRDHLTQIALDTIRGETTKAEGFMIENGGDCVMVSPDQRFKVLSVEYNLPGSDLGILEIIGSNKIRANGAWAYSVGAKEVK